MPSTPELVRKLTKKYPHLDSRIGEIVENMPGSRIVDKFQALGYEIKHYTRNIVLGDFNGDLTASLIGFCIMAM